MASTYPAPPTSSAYPPHENAPATGDNNNNNNNQSMDGRQSDYAPQPGLSSPNTQPDEEQPSEKAPTDPSAATPYTQGQDVKFNPAATPTSEYGMTPQSARQGQFPEYAQRPPYADQRYPPSAGQHPHMANHSPSPSQSLNDDGTTNQHQPVLNGNSDNHIPVDPNIAASSPTYPQQQHPHYAPYPQHDMGHYQPMYGRPGEYPPPPAYGHYPPHYGPPPMMGRPGPPGAGVPMSTVYSFVPIPGTHQQKRPRRRYEEIERMYKCGWNGCEKAYGTLNHLNAHVTMQSHGVKRTPEEFKEIRKDWKQRKKEEEQSRKDDDRSRTGEPQGPGGGPPSGDGGQSSAGYAQGPPRQLPPLGYAPAGGQPGQPQPYPQPDGQVHQYQQGYYAHGPGSPYGPQPNQMYAPNQQAPPQAGPGQAVSDGS